MMKSVKRQEYFIITVNLIFEAHPIKIWPILYHVFFLFGYPRPFPACKRCLAHWDLCGIRAKKNYFQRCSQDQTWNL